MPSIIIQRAQTSHKKYQLRMMTYLPTIRSFYKEMLVTNYINITLMLVKLTEPFLPVSCSIRHFTVHTFHIKYLFSNIVLSYDVTLSSQFGIVECYITAR